MNASEIRQRFVGYYEGLGFHPLPRAPMLHPSLPTIRCLPYRQRTAEYLVNVLRLSPNKKVVPIAENRSVNEWLLQLGFEVVTLPFSGATKLRGVCDTLRVERAGFAGLGPHETASVSLSPGGDKCQ